MYSLIISKKCDNLSKLRQKKRGRTKALLGTKTAIIQDGSVYSQSAMQVKARRKGCAI